jgi:hypothetical protein
MGSSLKISDPYPRKEDSNRAAEAMTKYAPASCIIRTTAFATTAV